MVTKERENSTKRKLHLYITPSNPMLWLSALCMIGSTAAQLVFPGERSWYFYGMLFVPVLYALACVLFGSEMFYKTAIPVWLTGLFLIPELHQTLGARSVLLWVSCVCIVLFCGVYTFITAGSARPGWLLAVYLPAVAGVWYIGSLTGKNALAGMLYLGAMALLLPGLKVHTDDGFHPTWGDRIDGRRIRSAPAMELITPYFMVNRNGAANLFSDSAEITELERYVRRKRKEGLTGFGMSHVIMAAYVRTVAKYPALNRFIAGQKLYSRGNDIILCMTVKKEMSLSSPDTVLKVHLNPADTAEDVYRKYASELENAKDSMQTSGTDDTAGLFMLVPGLILKAAVWLLKTLDYFGQLPGFLMDVSPFHGSVYFTSIGSLGIKPVYHHLYDFGVIPVFCAFGRKRRAEELVDGEVVVRKYVDLKFTLDERICDGYYYASAIKHFMRLLSHPESLDAAPEVVQTDIP